MAIFNSYVNLPEGNYDIAPNKAMHPCATGTAQMQPLKIRMRTWT